MVGKIKSIRNLAKIYRSCGNVGEQFNSIKTMCFELLLRCLTSYAALHVIVVKIDDKCH